MDTEKKYMMVADIISLCGENDRLREQVKTLNEIKREQQKENGTAEISLADAAFIAIGKKTLTDKVLDSWRILPTYNDDSDTWQSFEDWCGEHVNRDRIPDWMSFAAFTELCDKQLHEVYDAKLKEAIKDQ